jgi:hypothetical protein
LQSVGDLAVDLKIVFVYLIVEYEEEDPTFHDLPLQFFDSKVKLRLCLLVLEFSTQVLFHKHLGTQTRLGVLLAVAVELLFLLQYISHHLQNLLG